MTTIRQSFRMISEKAIEMTLALVNGETEPGVKLLSRGDLVVRSSVAR
jgi:DNA-binding LacI/PurR family transcriptional regulator